MVSLLDIGEVSEEVSVRGKQIVVTGISGKGLVALLSDFPEIRKLIADRGSELLTEDLIKIAPDAAAAVIAAGCGTPGDKQAVAIAGTLGVGEQVDLLEAIFRLTFPRGIGPFVEKLSRMTGANGVEGGPGWDPATKSHGRLNDLLRQGTRPG